MTSLLLPAVCVVLREGGVTRTTDSLGKEGERLRRDLEEGERGDGGRGGREGEREGEKEGGR